MRSDVSPLGVGVGVGGGPQNHQIFGRVLVARWEDGERARSHGTKVVDTVVNVGWAGHFGVEMRL